MENIEPVLSEVQERLPALTAWSYIAIWAFSEMMQRMGTNPDDPRFVEIRFPHTRVPLFSASEAANLEAKWRESKDGIRAFLDAKPENNDEDEDTDDDTEEEDTDDDTEEEASKGQHGGRLSFPPTIKQLKKGSKKIGQALGSVLGNVDPELFSLDKQFKTVTDTLDNMDAQISELSKDYGLVALESVSPDPKFVIPLGPVPIPITIPIRTILPSVTLLLEALRIMSTLVPYTSFLGKPVTAALVLLDLARGNLYQSMFSFIGFFGKYAIYASVILKVFRSMYELISPDVRGELRDIIFRSGKSFVTGSTIWIFSIFAPEVVRRPLNTLSDKIRMVGETINSNLELAEQKLVKSLGRFANVTLPRVPTEKIPDISDLYAVQELIHNPMFYCHPDVSPLIEEIRAIPPLALFFDLLSIPAANSAEYAEKCAGVATTPIAEQFAPKIEFKNPLAGLTAPTNLTPAQ
jgi:hypothetical protein